MPATPKKWAAIQTGRPPFFFSKLTDAVTAPRVDNVAQIAYPPQTQDLHHEVELVVAIGSAGNNLSASQATALIAGFAVGIDFTRRDLQATAKANRRPWLLGKNFAGSGPVSELSCKTTLEDLTHAEIELRVNNRVRQNATLDQMLWSVPEIIAELSRFLPVAPGDLIFTGTPAGVSAVNVGDRLQGQHYWPSPAWTFRSLTLQSPEQVVPLYRRFSIE